MHNKGACTDSAISAFPYNALLLALRKVQYETDSMLDPGDDCGMSTPAIVETTPQINERLWQAWVVKNRELDRRGAARRLRFLKVVVAVVLAGVVIYSYLG